MTDRRKQLEERLARPDWKDLARAVKFAARGCCQICGRRFPYPFLGLQVHHNTYERLGHEFMADLTALCVPCHAHTTYRLRYGDLACIPGKEILGIIETACVTLDQVHAFYARRVKDLRDRADAVWAETRLLMDMTEAGREWQEWHDEQGRRAA